MGLAQFDDIVTIKNASCGDTKKLPATDHFPRWSEPSTAKTQLDQEDNPLNTTNFLSVATLWWLQPLLKIGFEAPLDERDVWPLPTVDQAHVLKEKFAAAYSTQTDKAFGRFKRNGAPKRPNVKLAIWKSVRSKWWTAVACYLASAGFMLFQPFLVKAILKNINGEENDLGISSGYVLAVLLGFSSLCGSTIINAGIFLTTRLACNARMIFINSTFDKLLRLSATARRTMNMGEIVTFVSVDSYRVMLALKDGLWLLIAPLMLIAASTLVGCQLGLAVALAVVAAQVAIVCGVFCISRQIGKYRQQISTVTATRASMTNEMLQGIRVVKLYGWESFANDYIREIRDLEVSLLRKYNYLRLSNAVLMSVAPILLNVVCFTTTILLGKTVDVATTFTILALTNACSNPFGIFAEASIAATEALTSAKRLSAFLVSTDTASAIMDVAQTDEVKPTPIVSLKDAAFQWQEDAPAPTLSNINLTLQPGALTVVVGAVGSGKSSLVNAILGEMQQVRGSRKLEGNFAYASQQAWIQSQTVRDNILFGESFDVEHYQQVVLACQLAQDFKMLEHGDQTEIGERGISLSGGQKARVSVARAMYRARKFDFVVLDDPLSALDVHVANAVFSDGLCGIAKDKTRLLVLNSHYHLLQHADRVLVMSEGQIVGDGTLAEVQSEFSFLMTSQHARGSKEASTDEKPSSGVEQKVATDAVSGDIEKAAIVNTLGKENRQVGSVQLQTYVDYLATSGWNGYWLCGSILALFTITQCLFFSSDWFLSQWAKGTLTLSQIDSLKVYVGMVTVTILLAFARCHFIIEVCMSCSVQLHFKHLRKVIAAPVNTFFDVTPIGQILNRFSRDLDEVDNPLPYWGVLLLLSVFQMGLSMMVCAATNVFVLFIFIPMGYGCLYVANVYQASARELKRLDSVTRSPVLNLVSETISGIDTIRSYNMVKLFSTRCEKLLDHNAKFFFAYQAASRWFSMRIAWLASVVLGTVAVLSVSTKATLGASVAGLALTYAAQISSNVQRMITLSTQVESIMTCFERIAHYNSLDVEGDKCVPTNKDTVNPQWPHTGAVEFKNVAMRYRDDLPLILKSVSFSVKSGEKVGICGRTGSGKSSLMSVLFRTVELASGQVCIDGVDISSITVHQLRTKLTIIPQDPMLFSGSLRMNLDPFAEQSDDQLWDVLRKVHLADIVSGWGRGLDYEVAEKGENLSVGQRQLLCIARALIRDSKVIVMDEATANVDQESDKLIQQTMKESFGGGDRTILCIAHRLETIMDSDKILVLDAGVVAEFASPSSLLQVNGGIFRSLVQSSSAVCA